MKKKKILIVVSALLALSVVMTACAGSPDSDETQRATPYGIATAPVGGAFYTVGQAIANVVNSHYSEVNLNAEVTNGALENNRLISSGEVAFGITNSDLAYYAYNGEDPYDGKQEVAAVGNLHPSILHLITLENSPINSIKDLKGKRVAVGPAGGAGHGMLSNILEENGMTLDDITPIYLSFGDGFTQLADGNMDAALAVSGYPAAAVIEISATKDIKFIPIDEESLANLIAKFPYYSEFKVPKSVYSTPEDFSALGLINVSVCDPSMDEDIVYNVCKALYDNLDELKANNKSAAQIDENTLDETPIPLHPGAKRYFDEK